MNLSVSDHLSVTSRVVAYERFHCTVFDDELAAVTASFVSVVLKLVRNPTTDRMLKEGPIQQRCRRVGLRIMLMANMKKYAEKWASLRRNQERIMGMGPQMNMQFLTKW